MASTPDDLLALEAKVVKAAAGSYLDAIAEIRLLLATEPGRVRAKLLAMAAPTMTADILKGLGDAYMMGHDDATGDLDPEKKKLIPKPKGKLPIPKKTLVGAAGLTLSSKKVVDAMKTLVRSGGDIEKAAAMLFGDSLLVRQTITFAVHAARNDAVTNVAKAADQPMTIEAERDACVICLRHQGEVTKTGVFPPGLTYGKVYPGTPRTCPFHPFCRCRLVVLNDQSYADALRREADRSILRGVALPSESTPARIRAADKLIRSGVDAPASVIKKAKVAVKKGSFGPRRPAE